MFQDAGRDVAVGVQAEIQLRFYALMWFFFNFADLIVLPQRDDFFEETNHRDVKVSAKEVYDDLHEEHDQPSDS